MTKTQTDMRLKNGVPDVRHEIIFRLSKAPDFYSSSGEIFRGEKVVVSYWPFLGKAHVRVSGMTTPRNETRSTHFNLMGYDYPPCPMWLLEFVREAGYREAVEV